MTDLRQELPERPRRLIGRPIDHRGYPVPWFVTIKNDDGTWNFTTIDPARMIDALRHRKCWLCGERLGRYGVFVIGPMCGITRTSAEPPCHLDCAEFAAKACPFLVRPQMKRNEAAAAPGAVDAPGHMLKRNPGVTMLWAAEQWKPVQASGGGILLNIGDAVSLSYWREGRRATAVEILESIDTGIGSLIDAAKAQGPAAIAALSDGWEAFKPLLPSNAAKDLELLPRA